jgi:hypothetical protein
MGIACLVCTPNMWTVSDDVGPTEVSIPPGGVVDLTMSLETWWVNDKVLKAASDARFGAIVAVYAESGTDSADAQLVEQHVHVELADNQGATDDADVTGGPENLGLDYQFCDGSDCDDIDGTACDSHDATSCTIEYHLVLSNVGDVDTTVEWSAFAVIDADDRDFPAEVHVELTVED